MLKWCQLSDQITCNFLLAVSSNNVSIMHSFLYITTCNREWPSSILQFEYNSWNSIVCVWRTTIMYLVSCIIHVILKIFALETFPVSSMIFKGRSRFLTMTCVDGSYDVLFMFYSRPKCAYDMMYLFREIEPEGNCHRILTIRSAEMRRSDQYRRQSHHISTRSSQPRIFLLCGHPPGRRICPSIRPSVPSTRKRKTI